MEEISGDELLRRLENDANTGAHRRCSYSAHPVVGNPRSPKTTAEVHPSQLGDHWYLSVLDRDGVEYTPRPASARFVADWFRAHGLSVEVLSWQVRPCELLEKNPWDNEPAPAATRLAKVVYFIQATGGGLIKIGSSESPLRRYEDLQNMSPVPLEFVGVVSANDYAESSLHRRFAHLRMHGEWFFPAQELLDFIDEAVLGSS